MNWTDSQLAAVAYLASTYMSFTIFIEISKDRRVALVSAILWPLIWMLVFVKAIKKIMK